MTSRADLLPPDIAAAAAAIANARAGRRGAPAIANVLDLLPQKLFDEVVEDARAVRAALAELPPKPRASGALRGTDAFVLGQDLGAGTVLILARDKVSRPSGVLWGVSAGAGELAPDLAAAAWAAVTKVVRASVAVSASPASQESAP